MLFTPGRLDLEGWQDTEVRCRVKGSMTLGIVNRAENDQMGEGISQTTTISKGAKESTHLLELETW